MEVPDLVYLVGWREFLVRDADEIDEAAIFPYDPQRVSMRPAILVRQTLGEGEFGAGLVELMSLDSPPEG
jgi:hypothetical protein